MINLKTIQHFLLTGRAVFSPRDSRGTPRPTLNSSHPNCSVWFFFSPQVDSQHCRFAKGFLRAWLDRLQQKPGSARLHGDPGWAGPARWAPVSISLWDECSVAGRTRSKEGTLQIGDGFWEQQFTPERARNTNLGNWEEKGFTKPHSQASITRTLSFSSQAPSICQGKDRASPIGTDTSAVN